MYTAWLFFISFYYKLLDRATESRYTKCEYILRFTDSIFTLPVAGVMVVTRSVVHCPAKSPLPW